jgi:aromatic-amino-acid transaminase
MFDSFKPYLGDPILSLLPRFQSDPRADKVNLSIGLYYNDAGELPVLRSVSSALAVLSGEPLAAPYLPMAGHDAYRQAVQELLFGAEHACLKGGQVSTIQTLGGTGALKIGCDVLWQHFPASEVWVCEPTWDNHLAICAGSGFAVRRYPYFDPLTQAVDFAAMVDCLLRLAPRSIVLLHACCHNPTGADLSRFEWDRVVDIVRSRDLIPFFDFAYQGFGEGIDEDCYPIRSMASAGLSFLVANSFSKNFALYGERCGALSFVCQNRGEAERAQGQMELAVRRNYSSPPRHGGSLVAQVLLDPRLRTMWRAEVDEMRWRIKAMRRQLYEALSARCRGRDLSHLLRQQGMFSDTGLSSEAVGELRERFAIYLVQTGRLCLAGLNAGNVERVADAIAEVTQC